MITSKPSTENAGAPASDQETRLEFLVNMRPPLPQGCLGNGGYLRSALDYLEMHLGKVQSIVRSLSYVNCIDFEIINWSRLTFYEVDFGWGQPV